MNIATMHCITSRGTNEIKKPIFHAREDVESKVTAADSAKGVQITSDDVPPTHREMRLNTVSVEPGSPCHSDSLQDIRIGMISPGTTRAFRIACRRWNSWYPAHSVGARWGSGPGSRALVPCLRLAEL